MLNNLSHPGKRETRQLFGDRLVSLCIWLFVTVTGVTWCSLFRSGDRPGRQLRWRQHGTFIFFRTKNLHEVQIFCAKGWNLPPCRRRIGPVVQASAWFGTDRV